jgi:glucan phosphoethanolaminetransferase (alkaline phosphatase superfamily)
MTEPSPTAPPRFAPWRLACWVLLLLAALGILQYVDHAWQVAALLRDATDATALRHMLIWDIAYLAGACVVLSAAAGALLRREWARRLLRVVAALLAVWALVTAIAILAQWNAFQHVSAQLLAQPDTTAGDRALLAHARRVFMAGTALKLAAVPVLAWLAWRLGVPGVRAQFRARRS